MHDLYRRCEAQCADLRQRASSELGRSRLERERIDWHDLACAAGLSGRTEMVAAALGCISAFAPPKKSEVKRGDACVMVETSRRSINESFRLLRLAPEARERVIPQEKRPCEKAPATDAAFPPLAARSLVETFAQTIERISASAGAAAA
jgi:hypothetical protein